MKAPKTIRLNFKLIHKLIRNWKREDAKRLKRAKETQ